MGDALTCPFRRHIPTLTDEANHRDLIGASTSIITCFLCEDSCDCNCRMDSSRCVYLQHSRSAHARNLCRNKWKLYASGDLYKLI